MIAALLAAASFLPAGGGEMLGAADLAARTEDLRRRIGDPPASVDGNPVAAGELVVPLFLTDTEALYGALESAVRARLVRLESGRLGVTVPEQQVRAVAERIVEARADEFRLDAGPDADFFGYLRERYGVSEDLFRTAVATRVLEEQLLARLVRFELGARERVVVRVLVVDDVDEARELLESLREGANFAALARKKSLDASASRGGLFPPVPADCPHPLLVGTDGLEPGGLAEVAVVEARGRRLYRLLKLEQRLPADPRPYAERREEIERGLAERPLDPFEVIEWDRIVRARHRLEVGLGRG